MNAFGQDLEETIHDAVPFLGSSSEASSVDPFTSANRIVTCLRSPSRALRDVRIFSVRWGIGGGNSRLGGLFPQRRAAVAAELPLRLSRCSTGRADTTQPSPALRAEAAVGTIGVPARWTGGVRLRLHELLTPVALPGVVVPSLAVCQRRRRRWRGSFEKLPRSSGRSARGTRRRGSSRPGAIGLPVRD